MVIGAADVRSQGHAIGGGGANGRRAPHIHLSDATRNLRYGTKFGYYLFTGQQPLIDHFHLSVLPVGRCAFWNSLLQNETPLKCSRGVFTHRADLIFRVSSDSSELAPAEKTERN